MRIEPDGTIEQRLDDLDSHQPLDDKFTRKLRRLWLNYGVELQPRIIWHRFWRTCKLVKLYWRTEDCDWSTLVKLMHFQVRRTRLHIQEHDLVADADRICRDMLVAEHLLKRMADDEYHEIARQRFPNRGKDWSQMWREIEQQDLDMLCEILRKHLKEWWD